MPVVTRSRARAQLADSTLCPPVADEVRKPPVSSSQSITKKRNNNEESSAAPALKKAKVKQPATSSQTSKQAGRIVKMKESVVTPGDSTYAESMAVLERKKSNGPRPILTENEQKRVEKWESIPSEHLASARQRALRQRMFVIDRERTGTEDEPEEILGLAGSTGNIYRICIRRVPSCSCPQGIYGRFCKHIIYVLIQVLKAPPELQCEFTFHASELAEMFKGAPLPTVDVEECDGNRKPVEDDCAICFCELDKRKEEIVWCQAACGNNLHKACFDQWSATKRASYSKVTCPYCRTVWQELAPSAPAEGLMKKLANAGTKGTEGYINIGAALGLPSQRDYSDERKESHRRAKEECKRAKRNND